MKTNLSALMNLISEKEKKYANLCIATKTNALNTTVQELDGTINVIEDTKETFQTSLDEMITLSTEITKLKSILYSKNNSFKLSDGRTIQSAIVDNNNKRQLKSSLESLLIYKNTKRRVTEVNNSYFEIKEINFDANFLKEKVSELEKQIQTTDFEISKLNSAEFEI